MARLKAAAPYNGGVVFELSPGHAGQSLGDMMAQTVNKLSGCVHWNDRRIVGFGIKECEAAGQPD